MKKRLLITLFILFIFIPLGLLTNSPAWGEWDSEYYQKILGFIPQGIAKTSVTNTLLDKYGMSGVGDIMGYYISAFIGIALLFIVYLLFMKIFTRREKNE